MNTKSLRQLDILGGGLRLSTTQRKNEGVLRFNNTTKKLEIYTGQADIDGNEWIDISQRVATEDILGSVKIGNNLYMNPNSGVLNAISVGPSMFYQHIITVSKYDIPFEQHNNTELPDGTVVEGGSGDFTSISDALTFIENLDSDEYPRNSENQWLIYIAPGVYKENFTLQPFVSIRGYGKSVTILEPKDDTNNHINLTTDTSLFDLSINFENNLDISSKTLINVDTSLGRNSIPTNEQVFTNKTLIKNVDFGISGVNSLKCVNILSGNLDFEDTFISLSQDIFESDDISEIYGFYLDGGTNLNINEGKFNFVTNHQNFTFCRTNISNVSMVNSFVDVKENLNENLKSGSQSIIFESLNSDIELRNCQLMNYSINGNVFNLNDSTDRSLFSITDDEISSLVLSNRLLLLKTPSQLTKTSIINKISNKRGVKLLNNNYKISHIKAVGLDFELQLDEDRHSITNQTFKYENVEDISSISEINVINSSGNKYLLNGNTVYDDTRKYLAGIGTYVLKDVPVSHPMAILNSGKETLISYTGDETKMSTSTVDDVSYNFYHGDITVTVVGNYDKVSLYCRNHGFMGGEDLLLYKNSVELNILNVNSVANSFLRANNYIINSSSDNFIIENNDVSKEQGDYNITGESLVEFNDFNVIHVSNDKGDFNTISQALNSMGKTDSNLKYLIRVHSGSYTETQVINLLDMDNVSIIGDSKVNTEINFNLSETPDDGILIHGGNGLIENLKFIYRGNILDDELVIMNFSNKNVNINNLDFSIESNNLKTINLSSCDTSNLRNLNLDLKYFFKEDGNGNTDKVIGINGESSNTIEMENVKVNISSASSFNSSIDNSGKTIQNINLINTAINCKNIDLNLNTELTLCNLIKSTDTISNNFKNQIYGNSLILNSSDEENYILDNESTGRFLIINSNILGDFNGDNIFTTGSVLIDNSNMNVHSYHTSLLSNNKDSILIGNDAGASTMGNSATRNILIGKESGKNIDTGNDNLLIGNESGSSLSNYSGNILLGNESGKILKGNNALMIGNKSGFNSQNSNLFVGNYSGYNITGENNIILGNETSIIAEVSSYSNIKTDDNIFIGNNAGIETSGSKNISIGEGSGILDSGINSINVGSFIASSDRYDSETAISKTVNGFNVNMGHMAGRKSQNTSRNINVGAGAGELSESSDNINIGFQTGKNIIGTSNTLLGSQTGNSLKGNNNVAIGNNCLLGDGEIENLIINNVIVGEKAGQYVLSNQNVILGAQAAELNSEKKISNENIIIGYQAGNSMGIENTSNSAGPTGNIFMGKQSGNNCQSNNNVYLGNNSGTVNVSGSQNIFVGVNTGASMTTGSNSVIIGNNAGQSTTVDCDGEVLMGSNAGSAVTGTQNSLIGFNSGRIAGDKNTFMGYKSGENSAGDSNTILGHGSGRLLQTDFNVVVGDNSLTAEISSGIANDGNTILGSNSGKKIVAGGNTYIGYKAGENNSGTNNTIIGSNANSLNTVTENNVVIGKDAGKNINGNNNLVIGTNAGECNSSNNINDCTNIGYRAGINNNKYSNLFVIGSDSGRNIRQVGNTYYSDSENIILGNKSLQTGNSMGNIVIGNNAGNKITSGESNNFIGEKTGDNLVSGSDNMFIGSGKSLIYKKVAGTVSNHLFDLSNTYYNSSTDIWELDDSVSNPNRVTSNDVGAIEFIVKTPITNSKVLGIKSKTTYQNHRFSTVNVNSDSHLIKVDGTSGFNQLKNKKFIRNFGGNSWGEYVNQDSQSIVPDLSITTTTTFTSRQIFYDSENTTSYKTDIFPIKFAPDDIVRINFKVDGISKEIIVKIYALVQVVKKKNGDDINYTGSGAVTMSDLVKLQSGSDVNDYEIMDERMYFDILQDDSLGSSNFAIDYSNELSIVHISSSGQYNQLGNENLFLGIESGNSNLGEKNLAIGYHASKNSDIGNNNTILGNNAGEFMREGENNTLIGQNAGKYISSTGNTFIGKGSGVNVLDSSNNILLGQSTGSNISGDSNIMIGNNNSGNSELKPYKNNLILGNSSKLTNTNGDNNVILGNGVDNEMDNSLIIGNKKLTKIRDINFTIHNSHLYLPVKNAQLFGYDDLLKVYNQSSPSTFNYLNTETETDNYYPHKSIIHTFPLGQVSIEENEDYYELRDRSRQLRYIEFLDNSNTNTDFTESEFSRKRPIISIETLGNISSSNNCIYEVYSLPVIEDQYDSIKIKKLQSSSQSFDTSEIDTSLDSDSEYSNIQIRIDNNILVLSDNSSDTPFGRLEAAGNNIFGHNRTALTISADMYVEKIVSALTTVSKGNSITDFPVENAKQFFRVGDVVRIGADSNTSSSNYSNADYTIIGVADNQITLDTSVTIPEAINDDSKRVIRVSTNNPIISNFNNNKVVVNGDKDDLEDEKATMTVKGSIGLTDFLLLKVSDQANVELSNNESIIWLEENSSSKNPELKIRYKNSDGTVKSGTINLSIS